ncbi:MAG: hypothetical protein KA365_00265 [Arenimonas sp.]|nr:hypothetical protein [Arenimonas sp.]
MNSELQDFKVNVKLKLSALWASLVLCYLYGDYFGLYVPGSLQSMLDGKMGPLGATTQGVLIFTSAMMAIPSLMVALSLLLKPAMSRWMNIVFGLVYTAIILMTMPGAWHFYIFLGIIEATLTLIIVWNAWHWPKANGT